jgi:ribosomal protein S18 acetylase RimI-like enzyme
MRIKGTFILCVAENQPTLRNQGQNKSGEIIVGALQYDRWDNFWFIDSITIEPEYRRKGYGSKLLELGCQKLHEQSALLIRLQPDSLKPGEKNTLSNLQLRKWYERHNFVEIDYPFLVRKP